MLHTADDNITLSRYGSFWNNRVRYNVRNNKLGDESRKTRKACEEGKCTARKTGKRRKGTKRKTAKRRKGRTRKTGKRRKGTTRKTGKRGKGTTGPERLEREVKERQGTGWKRRNDKNG